MTSIVAPNRLLWADPDRNPLSTDGVNGDSWVNWQTTVLFQKKSNKWQARFKMRGGGGPQGNPGRNGISLLHGTVPPSELIGRVGEWYIWTTAPEGPRLYGPRGPNSWPTTYAGLSPFVFKSGPPAAGDGVDGQYLLDRTAGVLYGPKTSGAWPAVPAAVFKAIITGSGAPSNALGVDGQVYFDTDAAALYGAKTAGAWPTDPAILKAVLIGSGAPSNALGANGQLYIDTANAVLYGPRAGGSWPAGISLVGPIAVWQGDWSAGTTYAKDQGVSKTLTSGATGAFVSRVNANIGNDPETSPTQWQALYSTPPGGLVDEDAIALAIAYGG